MIVIQLLSSLPSVSVAIPVFTLALLVRVEVWLLGSPKAKNET